MKRERKSHWNAFPSINGIPVSSHGNAVSARPRYLSVIKLRKLDWNTRHCMMGFKPMRRALLTGMMLFLLLALGTVWAFRFQRLPNLQTWHLADLRKGFPVTEGVEWQGQGDDLHLRLSAKSGSLPLAIRLALPGIVPISGLHLRFQMSARNLVQGAEKWEDGRFMVEWLPKNGDIESARDSIGSIRGDKLGRSESLVILAPNDGAVPVLRLENLARSGDFDLSGLEISAVQESGVWKVGRWVLAAAWMLWAALCVRSWPGVNRWRAFTAAALWVILSVNLVIPGPWHVQRPMFPEFQLGKTDFPVSTQITPSKETISLPRVSLSGPVAALGKQSDQGSLLLRVKLAIKRARPLLHALALFGPTLAFLILVGRRPALFLAILLALAIELGEVAFGYGFGWDDVMDLVTDGIGIALAVILWSRMRFWVARLR